MRYIFAVRKQGAIAQSVEQRTENPCVPVRFPWHHIHQSENEKESEFNRSLLIQTGTVFELVLKINPMKEFALLLLLSILVFPSNAQDNRVQVLQDLEHPRQSYHPETPTATLSAASRLFADKDDLTSVMLVIPKERPLMFWNPLMITSG